VPPLLLFVDSWLGQLPLEACPCLARRQVVRGIAPNIALRAWAGTSSRSPHGGYFVIDPSSPCSASGCADSGVASNVLSFFRERASTVGDGSRWTGHVGSPGPDSGEVLRQLATHSNFLYIGHGECARRLLQSERLEKGAPRVHASLSVSAPELGPSRVPLQSVVALMGCSSARLASPPVVSSAPYSTLLQPIPRCQFEEFEAFGLPLSLLIGGSPGVLGAARDILAGDVDRLTCALLRVWARKDQPSTRCSLLAALREVRAARKCMLPNLTGASLVYYGIPV